MRAFNDTLCCADGPAQATASRAAHAAHRILVPAMSLPPGSRGYRLAAACSMLLLRTDCRITVGAVPLRCVAFASQGREILSWIISSATSRASVSFQRPLTSFTSLTSMRRTCVVAQAAQTQRKRAAVNRRKAVNAAPPVLVPLENFSTRTRRVGVNPSDHGAADEIRANRCCSCDTSGREAAGNPPGAAPLGSVRQVERNEWKQPPRKRSPGTNVGSDESPRQWGARALHFGLVLCRRAVQDRAVCLTSGRLTP